MAAGRRRFSALLGGVIAVLAGNIPAAQASTLATLELSTNRAAAGEEVSFRGWYYNDVHPVVIHWERIEGPVLATVTPDTFGPVHNHFRSIAGTLRIPPDAPPGTHLLLATQDFAPPGKITFGVPARAEIRIGDAPTMGGLRIGAAGYRRPASITVTEPLARGRLLTAALAGAVLAAVLAVLGVFLPARRSRRPR